MKVQRVPNEPFGAICINSTNYKFCIIALQSLDGVEHLDLNELGNIAILSATIHARLNKHLLRVFLDNETYPDMKSQLENCFVDYNVMLGKLEAAYKFSDCKDYVRMKGLVNDAMKMSVKCEDINFVNVLHSPIEVYSNVLVTRNSIALSILDELDG